jgi:hypothetical protein
MSVNATKSLRNVHRLVIRNYEGKRLLGDQGVCGRKVRKIS